MKNIWRRCTMGAIALLVCAGSLLTASSANAQPVDSGTLTFSGDPGDWITFGESYAYDTAAGDRLDVVSSGNATVGISMEGANGDFWSLDFDAPSGQILTPGVTYTATRFPFNGAGAGLSLSGNGRGCNTLTGTFTVLAASFGDAGYVETFHATFEQHCEGGTPAARGEVRIDNPPPPPPLALDVTVSVDATVSTVSGRATLTGTTTCSEPVTITLNGVLTQIVRREIVRGMISTSVACTPGGPVSWSTYALPSGTTPFVRGKAEADVTASAFDETYGRTVTASTITIVQLRRA